MKQILPTEKHTDQPVAFLLILSLVLALFTSGCATLPRKASSEGRLGLESSAEASKVDINTASAIELEKLPGIGKVIAERIVDHRAQYGPFRRAEHLMMVRGISEQKFLAIRSLISVE